MKHAQQGISPFIIIGVAALIALVGAVGFVMTQSRPPEQAQTPAPAPQAPTPPAASPQPTPSPQPVTPAAQASFSGALLAGTPQTPLLDFVKSDYDKAQQEKRTTVLFFYANWCPTCAKSFPEAQAAFHEFAKNGVNVIGFRVNYNDDETDQDEKDLAKKYEITYQDTKVIIKDGQMQTKSLETWDKSRYLEEINSI